MGQQYAIYFLAILLVLNQQNFLVYLSAKIGQTVSEISRFANFQDGRRPPSWILKLVVNII